tara:strand:+ start:341 stop:676 length:336 start_codon:yes stop_codon:yes gene_type:complete
LFFSSYIFDIVTNPDFDIYSLKQKVEGEGGSETKRNDRYLSAKIKALPEESKKIMGILFPFLYLVSLYKEKNKMVLPSLLSTVHFSIVSNTHTIPLFCNCPLPFPRIERLV